MIEAANDALTDEYYAHLLALAKNLEKADQILPAILCYRALSEQILKEARSKAYGHASRYVAKVAALHAQLDDYRGFPDHDAYMAQLHGTATRAAWPQTRLLEARERRRMSVSLKVIGC